MKNNSMQPSGISHPSIPAAATAIYVYGNFRDEAIRLRFCNYLVRLGEFDDYPRRAEFISAFSAGGSTDARRGEARLLAQAAIIDAGDIADAVYWGCDPENKWATVEPGDEVI